MNASELFGKALLNEGVETIDGVPGEENNEIWRTKFLRSWYGRNLLHDERLGSS